jgi:hypothetical protein
MTTGPSFRTSGTSQPRTHCHIQEDMNPQKKCCEKSYIARAGTSTFSLGIQHRKHFLLTARDLKIKILCLLLSWHLLKCSVHSYHCMKITVLCADITSHLTERLCSGETCCLHLQYVTLQMEMARFFEMPFYHPWGTVTGSCHWENFISHIKCWWCHKSSHSFSVGVVTGWHIQVFWNVTVC